MEREEIETFRRMNETFRRMNWIMLGTGFVLGVMAGLTLSLYLFP